MPSDTLSIASCGFPMSLTKKILELEEAAIGGDDGSYKIRQGIMIALKHLGVSCPEEAHGFIHPLKSMGPKEVKQVIVVRSDLKMPPGKEDAQIAHASGAFIFDQLRTQEGPHFEVKLNLPERDWINHSYSKIVVVAHSEEELVEIGKQATRKGLKVHTIIDSGRTCFAQPTLTCIAIGPDYAIHLDPVTGHLRLR